MFWSQLFVANIYHTSSAEEYLIQKAQTRQSNFTIWGIYRIKCLLKALIINYIKKGMGFQLSDSEPSGVNYYKKYCSVILLSYVWFDGLCIFRANICRSILLSFRCCISSSVFVTNSCNLFGCLHPNTFLLFDSYLCGKILYFYSASCMCTFLSNTTHMKMFPIFLIIESSVNGYDQRLCSDRNFLWRVCSIKSGRVACVVSI